MRSCRTWRIFHRATTRSVKKATILLINRKRTWRFQTSTILMKSPQGLVTRKSNRIRTLGGYHKKIPTECDCVQDPFLRTRMRRISQMLMRMLTSKIMENHRARQSSDKKIKRKTPQIKATRIICSSLILSKRPIHQKRRIDSSSRMSLTTSWWTRTTHYPQLCRKIRQVTKYRTMDRSRRGSYLSTNKVQRIPWQTWTIAHILPQRTVHPFSRTQSSSTRKDCKERKRMDQRGTRMSREAMGRARPVKISWTVCRVTRCHTIPFLKTHRRRTRITPK